MKILFLCITNSARSQMAEGLAKQIFGQHTEVQSAGSKPTKVNTMAVEALKEAAIDISGQYSKNVSQLPLRFMSEVKYIVTLCDEEPCPTLVTKAQRLHWPLPDPEMRKDLSAEKQMAFFRDIRDTLRDKLFDLKMEAEK